MHGLRAMGRLHNRRRPKTHTSRLFGHRLVTAALPGISPLVPCREQKASMPSRPHGDSVKRPCFNRRHAVSRGRFVPWFFEKPLLPWRVPRRRSLTPPCSVFDLPAGQSLPRFALGSTVKVSASLRSSFIALSRRPAWATVGRRLSRSSSQASHSCDSKVPNDPIHPPWSRRDPSSCVSIIFPESKFDLVRPLSGDKLIRNTCDRIRAPRVRELIPEPVVAKAMRCNIDPGRTMACH